MESSNSAPLTQTLIKVGGLCAVVSGLLVAFSYLLHPATVSPAEVGNTRWIMVHGGFFIALNTGFLALVALLARYLDQRGASPWGVVGFALATVSLIFLSGLNYTELFVLPLIAKTTPATIAQHAVAEMIPSSPIALPIVGALFVTGFVLLGTGLIRTRAVPTSSAGVTMLGSVAFAIGMSDLVPLAVLRIGACVFGAGILLLGLALLSPPSKQDAHI